MSDVGHLTQLRWGVRAVLTLGVAASVTANILHARHNPISQAIAAWPPIALLLTVELTSRVPVHRRGLAAVRIAATAIIAGIAAWVSYWHMAGVAARYGESQTSAYLLPLSVDGLIVVASVCLVELGGRLANTVETVRDTMPQQALSDHSPVLAPTAAARAIDAATIDAGAQNVATLPATAPVAVRAAAQVKQQPHSIALDTSPVKLAGTYPSPTGTGSPVPAYVPTSDEDAAMYQEWQHAVAAGRQPSGADLARAAGRPDDATGVGRRAARRYRDAHAKTVRTASPPAHSPHTATPAPVPTAPPDARGDASVPQQHNGHRLAPTRAAP